MLKIGVCDDDAVFIADFKRQVEACFLMMATEASIDLFVTAAAFLESRVEEYDIIFLDVKINDANGLDVARQLRKRNPRTILVFISAYVEFAPEGYEVTALRYIIKKDMARKLNGCLHDAVNLLQSREHLTIKTTDGKNVILLLSEIWFVEGNNHNVVFHTVEAEYVTHDTLGNIAQRITSFDFMQVHRSYLVNMRNARDIHGCILSYPNGKKAAISRGNKQAAWMRFLAVQGDC